MPEEIKNDFFKDDDIPLNLIRQGISMKPDMIFGWKPEVETSNPPIPLYFDFVEHPLNAYHIENGNDVIVYQERRPKDSYTLHKWLANQELHNGVSSYSFKFP